MQFLTKNNYYFADHELITDDSATKYRHILIDNCQKNKRQLNSPVKSMIEKKIKKNSEVYFFVNNNLIKKGTWVFRFVFVFAGLA